MSAACDLVFVGDVHLDRDDPHLDAFLAFLDGLAATAGRVVLMGDLFRVWIGLEDMHEPHHLAVLSGLEALRRRGIVVRYVEGNRDFRVGAACAGRALDDAVEGGLVERHGGRSVFAIHGDLTHPGDRLYRAWRAVSRSRAAWAVVRAVPRGPRHRLVRALEARLDRANPEFKGGFPEAEVRAYARGFLERGHDAVVLGHFHVEKDLAAEPPSAPGRILVVPEWKGSRRYLRVTGGGEIRFDDA